jgi:hypothetical protein
MRVVLNDLVDLIVNAQAQQGVDVRWVRRLKRTREMRCKNWLLHLEW